MARRGDPQVLRLVVKVLRTVTDVTQEEFGRRSRVTQNQVSRMEAGFEAPAEEVLRRMARVADVPWVVVHLIRFFTTALAAVARQAAPRAEPAAAGRERAA